MAMDCVSCFLRFVCDGLKWAIKHIGWAIKHIGYATNVKSEIRILKEEMRKLEGIYADVDLKVIIANERFQAVKNQVVEWQSRVQEFKARVVDDLQLPLNCSCAVNCPNCWTRYKLGKRVALEHKEDVANLINDGQAHSNGTVVDPNLPSPIETNIRSIQEEAKRLWDIEADINSRVEATKRERFLIPKRQIEGWIKRVSEYKKNVSAIQNDFEEMEKSDHQKLPWQRLSLRAENLLKETGKLVSEGRSFEDVADPSRPAILVEQAKVFTIGQEEAYDGVLGLIKDEKVRRIGIHGMGGVGKTTLLKRINNYFKDSDFELIIWVTVSKDFTISEIQQKITKRCNVKVVENDTPHEMENKIRTFLEGRRYVLLLDDIWKPFDLSILGVPTGDDEVKSKILITSRFEGVCDEMQATKVQVGCLNRNDAWKLFTVKVGKAITSDPKIEKLAEQICQYCGGLPLAIEVIGIAMRGERTLAEWNDAKNTLEKRAHTFKDNEEKLFSHLKLSYDSLKNDTMRECFCYCALYSADWEIDSRDLVSCWIGEGLFDDECDNIDAARDKGYTIIRDLINAGLLKEVVDNAFRETAAILIRIANRCNVAMHDVLRDMALWIKKDEYKISKGRSGVGEISGKETRLGLMTLEEDKSTERRRKELAQFGKSAPNLSTLITTGECATLFTDDMLEGMNKLRVLHVYGGHECELPPSIGRLRNLRCLHVSNATFTSLEVLAELGSLRLLIMKISSFTDKLSFEGVISRLSKLQALILGKNNDLEGVESIGVSISELESLPCLEDLQLSISTTSFLKGLAHSPKLARCVSDMKITRTDISCFRLIQEVGSMDRLNILRIEHCDELREVVIEEEQGCEPKPDTLCNLTLLYLEGLDELIKFRVPVKPKNSLQYLKFIFFLGCTKLRFAYLGWPLPGLEVLIVSDCVQLEEIFKISEGSSTVFPSLRLICLEDCPMVKIICSDVLSFPSLQILMIVECEQLKRLPTGVIEASKDSLRRIFGSPRWWDALTWDSEEDKKSLLPLFKSDGNIGDDLEEDNIVDDHSEEDI